MDFHELVKSDIELFQQHFPAIDIDLLSVCKWRTSKDCTKECYGEKAKRKKKVLGFYSAANHEIALQEGIGIDSEWVRFHEIGHLIHHMLFDYGRFRFPRGHEIIAALRYKWTIAKRDYTERFADIFAHTMLALKNKDHLFKHNIRMIEIIRGRVVCNCDSCQEKRNAEKIAKPDQVNCIKEKSSAVKPDIIGLTSSVIVKIGRFAWKHIGREKDSHPGRIMLCWKRNDVCIETKERGKDHVVKEYPKLVDKGWKGHNRVFKYKIPTGLSHSRLIKSMNDIEFDLKSEVLFKLLENDPKAHFSLTVLSGHLLDRIDYTNEASIKPSGKVFSKGLWIPLGWSRRGLEQLNLASSNSPHLMIGGATGGGKSILGRLILAALHIRYTRDDCRLWLCDLKHGNGTARLGKDPLLVDRTISDPEEVEQMMDDLSKIIGERYDLFKQHECDDLAAYNEEFPEKRLPRIVVYVDEMTKLEGKEFKIAREKMTKVTGESRGSGVHVIISCHRPTANLVSGTMKNNFSAVVAFRCNAVSARVLLGEDEEDYKAAGMIDPDVEGRALFSFKDQVLIQVPFIDNKLIKDLMAGYQKPQKAQAETEPQLVKAAKNPTNENQDKKIGVREHLCDQPLEKTQHQRAKLRLVQPLGTKGSTKE